MMGREASGTKVANLGKPQVPLNARQLKRLVQAINAITIITNVSFKV